MSGNTKIEWANKVWNPVVGCTPVSAGCAHCYAKRMYERFYQGSPFSKIQLHPERLKDPSKWQKPARVFVNSMSDLFHEDVPFSFIDSVFKSMLNTPRHTFLVLTKRPERMWKYFNPGFERLQMFDFTLQNVWLGVSVEDQKTADERIPWLLKTPAAKRFVSVEPMLGPVDLERYLTAGDQPVAPTSAGVDWVICGGETGSSARLMHSEWIVSLFNQCLIVPFFFKSWGEWVSVGFDEDVSHVIISCGVRYGRVGKAKAGRLLYGKEWSQFPVEEK